MIWSGKTYPLDVPPETWNEFKSLHDADYDRINSRVVELVALDVATGGQLLASTDTDHHSDTADLSTEVQYELDHILQTDADASD